MHNINVRKYTYYNIIEPYSIALVEYNQQQYQNNRQSTNGY